MAHTWKTVLLTRGVLGLGLLGGLGTAGGILVGQKLVIAADETATKVPEEWMLSSKSGAWLVCAASYTGSDALEMARQCCQTLRERDKLPAYILNRGEEERKKVREEYETWRNLPEDQRGPKRRTVRVTEQCAVLIGGFTSIDQARAQLDKIKKLSPPKIQLDGNKATSDIVSVYVPVPGKGVEVRREEVNPFTKSFATRNPTIPVEKQDKPKFDPFLIKLNADESYSLLKSKSNWTLAVKEYRGATLTQPINANAGGSILDKLGFGPNKPGEALNASALQAHETARVLRKLEFDSHVLHTRNSSIVTVGGFQSLDDPGLVQLQAQLASLTSQDLKPLALFAQPVPMEIPRPGK